MSISLCQFWNYKSIPLQILYPFSVSWKITPLYFFSSNNRYFAQQEHTKMKIFETFKCSGQKFVKFLISILKWPVNSFSNFASFFIAMTHNSSMDCKLILFLLWIKGSYQSPNIETFKCSGENLPYSSFHFPNHKKIQSVFFRSNIKYFAQ